MLQLRPPAAGREAVWGVGPLGFGMRGKLFRSSTLLEAPEKPNTPLGNTDTRPRSPNFHPDFGHAALILGIGRSGFGA